VIEAGERTILRISQLSYRYGDLVAVDGLSLDVMRGEMFGLIGPDGAGKTTTLRTALGILRPASGEVLTCGLDPVRDHRALTDRVGYLSQRFSLYGDLTVDENVAFFAHAHGVRDWKRRRDELLELVRLDEFRGRLAERLSGGMKQKLALACTLIHTPELLILDEPTTGVDPVSRRDFWVLLSRLQRQGLTIVMTTPYLDEAERCQRVALMHDGRLLAFDEPRALQSGFAGVVVEIRARPLREAARALRGDPLVSQVELFGNRVHVIVSGGSAPDGGEPRRIADGLGAALRDGGIEVDSCESVLPSLEDVFISSIAAADSGS
jgi:ABC-2 type transport system ATP-binding protein